MLNFDFYNPTRILFGRDRLEDIDKYVVLRWLMQRGVVAIPKPVCKERIIESFNIFDVE